ncbi:hypothetical protein SEA_CRICKO_58 [Streptomyces phage CricKo]|jgi:hypothetical protein|nr:hypothetical protein SEA_RAINYDAI_56 [Streptomyces phage Rainydai]AWN06157.1 hypothetical protein SEA_SENDITCS_54 [Streptomyces phage SendItCS]QJD49941.1 hypothetical protein SEA_CRICKO_58 [Streptomyces phage CricKo]QNL30673.1 hypothetical protein SEA_THIQQUMS_58 [Streptomyces phage Thiqqums]WIC89392.1 hypothetical protein SEA_MIEK_55 [Streptomyces phage Miek]
MTGEPLDELYFKWLYAKVADPEAQDPRLTYWKILRLLFTKEFGWVVENDGNRVGDGKQLRIDFLREMGISHHDVDPNWIEIGCSVLEVMVGLAGRLEFEGGGEPRYWFWEHLMTNIGLAGYSDNIRFTERRQDRILDTLEQVMARNYEPNGFGGFFPLQEPRGDQRKVELWYQLSEYVMERELAG